MSDESPTQPTRSTADSIPPERAVPAPRITHTINNITDFFRPRNQPQRRLNATPTPIIIPQPHITATNTNPVLIPIQVIMESPSLMPTVNNAETIQDIPHSRAAEQEHDTLMTPQEQFANVMGRDVSDLGRQCENCRWASPNHPLPRESERQRCVGRFSNGKTSNNHPCLRNECKWFESRQTWWTTRCPMQSD